MSGTSFSTAARQVVEQWIVARWATLLNRTCLATFGVLLVGAVGWAVWTGQRPDIWFILGCPLAWIAMTALWAWYVRPTPERALAIWDESASRREMFVSAYCFERAVSRTAGEALHLGRAGRVLVEELPQLKKQLPARLQPRVALTPLVFVVVLQLIGYWQPATEVAANVPAIDPEAQQRASEIAATLAEKAAALDPLPGLNEKENKQVEELKQSLEQAAEQMKHLEDSTPREALNQLEQRARAAEELAEALGESEADKLSSEMLAEMERHADTADLAAALQNDDTDEIAAEATKLADKLEDKKLSLEERKRIQEALKKSLEVANKKDRQSNVGKHLRDAQQHLNEKKPALASKRLRDLAQSMSRRAQRNRSSRQLQQLARNLRSAGQQIFGRQNSGIQRLAQQQNQAGAAPRVSSARQISLAQLMAGQPHGQPSANQQQVLQPGGAHQFGQQQQAAAQQAGAQQAGGQQAGGNMAAAGQGNQQVAVAIPVPGSGRRPGKGNAPMPGAGGKPGGGGPIPIPGGGGQGQMPGAGGNSPGNSPGSGGAPGGAGGTSSTSSEQAGSGTAAMGNAPTKPLAARRQGTVQVQPSGEGPSQTREVEGQPHTEQAKQDPRQLAAEFIKVEEEALADEPLPVSRRDQVRRYFNALRQQLSDPPAKTEPKHHE
jgi:hypothetical protein